ncbi:MAG TPA: SDR family oxidoreductase [Candidatus Saccharimonadales bacterium]|nr:SDR family oxidoreductase [Candidatus Saccharimonadales bacterium]
MNTTNQQKPPQHQNPPGKEEEMIPQPESENPEYKAAGKLKDKVAIITGGDSGIGKATAIAFAKERAQVAIIYNATDEDAEKTKQRIEEIGQECVLIKGNVGDKAFCQTAVEKVKSKFGKIDILINNAGEQHPQKNIEDISEEQLRRTFQTNIFAMFFMVQAVLPHLQQGSAIVNTASITAYEGRKQLLDYSSTKGAIVSFTRSLSQNLIEKGIRVNAVAPGPIWTPLIPSTFPADKVTTFGTQTPMKRVGQPYEVAAGFVFLASDDASYISGQTLHINGGSVVNG